jgi:phosphotransferase system HPr (HPr) family protein
MDAVASKQVSIVNPNGLHARPACLFARLASRFVAQVAIIKDGTRVDGKSVLDLLMLGAVHGTQLTIEARGSDAGDAIMALAQLLEHEDPLDKMTE